MLKEPIILTISEVEISEETMYGGLIKVGENHYNYHPDWLELVEETKSKYPNIIKGLFFGNPKEYQWICSDELFEEIEIEDVVLVDTVRGEQIVQVVEKVVNNKSNKATKEVLGIMELVD